MTDESGIQTAEATNKTAMNDSGEKFTRSTTSTSSTATPLYTEVLKVELNVSCKVMPWLHDYPFMAHHSRPVFNYNALRN